VKGDSSVPDYGMTMALSAQVSMCTYRREEGLRCAVALLTCAAARMPGPGDVPVLNQRRLRGRRKKGMQDCIASFHWDKGSCAALCVTDKVGATFCRARPDAAI
jgi:hypothetical protein